jgi:hypothetical protein
MACRLSSAVDVTQAGYDCPQIRLPLPENAGNLGFPVAWNDDTLPQIPDVRLRDEFSIETRRGWSRIARANGVGTATAI